MFAALEPATLMESGWMYFPTALLLGALHGLEPGHSKTMMAAFIIAVRGTVRQAVLLGLAATLSHTVIIWLIVGLTLFFKDRIQTENFEPWMQMISGAMVIILSGWMAWRISADNNSEEHEHEHHHGHDHEDHDHHHSDNAHAQHQDAALANIEADDLHAKAHAEDIRRRFSGRTVTTAQIILFGLTGGLLPCPGAITVALLSLQADRAILGFALVVAFSLGLAATLVGVGAAAAWGAGHATRRFHFVQKWSPRLPYLSAAVLVVIGGMLLWHGYHGIQSTTH